MVRTPLRTAAALCLGVAGCGSAEDRVTLVPVVGKVTQGGKPVAGANLTFVPEPGNKDNTPGTAMTGPSGEYSASWRNRAGVAPGSYRVLVDPVTLTGAEVPGEFKDDPMMARLGAASRKAAEPEKAKALKTDFQASVNDKGGEFNFDLTPAPGPARR